jgi:hypothetical protein
VLNLDVKMAGGGMIERGVAPLADVDVEEEDVDDDGLA